MHGPIELDVILGTFQTMKGNLEKILDGLSFLLTLVYKLFQFTDFVAKNHFLPSFPGKFPYCFSATTGQDFN